MLPTKTPFNKKTILKLLTIALLVITATGKAVADCSPVVITNHLDINPFTAPTFDNASYAYYPITDGQTYTYVDANNTSRSFTLSGTSTVYGLHYKIPDLKVIAFFRQTINGAGGVSPQGTSESLEINFNSGAIDLLNFIISDLDSNEGVRVVGYFGATPVTPVVTNVAPNQTLNYLISGEAELYSDNTATDISGNTVSFNQPITKLVITNYKTINGDVGNSGGFNLHELKTSACPIPQTVPTLSEWALIILVFLLGIAGLGVTPKTILKSSKID